MVQGQTKKCKMSDSILGNMAAVQKQFWTTEMKDRQTTNRMVLSVRMRIHCGIGRFWRCFLPRMRLIRKVLWAG
jgi:hypothetical protein